MAFLMGVFQNHSTESTVRDPQAVLVPFPSQEKRNLHRYGCVSQGSWSKNLLMSISSSCLRHFGMFWVGITTFSTWPGWFQPRCSTPSTSPKRSKTTDTSVDLGECHGHSFAHFEWLDSENSYKPPINKKLYLFGCWVAWLQMKKTNKNPGQMKKILRFPIGKPKVPKIITKRKCSQ